MRSRFTLIFGLVLAVVSCGGDDEPVPDSQALERQLEQPPVVAPAPTAPEPEPEPEPEPLRGPLFTVQMGAFLNADSAAVQRDRLVDRGLPAWTEDRDVEGRRFHRVRIGAASTGSEARRLGEILTSRYGWSLWITSVNSLESVPDGAVQATQDLIGDGNGSALN